MIQAYRINGWDEDFDGCEWRYTRACLNYDKCGGRVDEREGSLLCEQCRAAAPAAERETE